MARSFAIRVALGAMALTAGAALYGQTPAVPKTDPLGRDNPRSTVIGFLEACQNRNYERAAEYLDLRHMSTQNRTKQGTALAKDLEGILNSAPHFSVLKVSRSSDGNPADDDDPDREHIASVTQKGQTYPIDLERVSLQTGTPEVWLFSAETVILIPKLVKSATPPVIARYLPPFLVSMTILETPLWKWLALILVVLILVSLGRLFDRMLRCAVKMAGKRWMNDSRLPIIEILIAPLRVILSLALFRACLQAIEPPVIVRLYIGRALELIFVSAVAWFLIKLVALLQVRIETVLDARHQYGSRSMLHMGRRVATVTIVVFAILVVLSNWGYNTTTLIAGLGVGGIAVALAAQQTIANVFGGVSIIGDQPVRIGDQGKFGDLVGTVEDIGMRSTRVRTPGRTIVSVPNTSFAGLNIENYSVRDKILFNTTLPLKRATAADQVRQAMAAVEKSLQEHKSVQGEQPIVRLTGITSSALNMEIFCYVMTADWHEFYAIQGDLLLAINEALKSVNVELA